MGLGASISGNRQAGGPGRGEGTGPRKWLEGSWVTSVRRLCWETSEPISVQAFQLAHRIDASTEWGKLRNPVSAPSEIQKVTEAVRLLDPQPRLDRWGHLSLCIIAATFSIGLRYDSVVAPLVRRYATAAELPAVLVEPGMLVDAPSPRYDEQSLSQFLDSIEGLSDEDWADKLRSRNRTSSRGGILKTAAVRQIARALVDEKIETLADVATLLKDLDRTAEVESRLGAIKGSGTQGIRTGYIWMTAGDDEHVKPDRHVLKWLKQVLGRSVAVGEARILLSQSARNLDLTPWSVDHAIWKVMARRRR